MIAITNLQTRARSHLRTAGLLRTSRSYDDAVYLCGYAVEIALKARICRTLRWTTGFPATNAEFQHFKSLQTHNLDALLQFTGIQARIQNPPYSADWSVVRVWTPELRYSPVGTQSRQDADDMIAATRNLLRALL